MPSPSSAKAPRMLIDSDVLIDYLRGHPAAATWLEDTPGTFLVSVISVAELYAGVRDGSERAALERFLTSFHVIDLDETVAQHGGLIRRDYRKSHGIGLADALIAAAREAK